jgi:hypothetical protein
MRSLIPADTEYMRFLSDCWEGVEKKDMNKIGALSDTCGVV